MKVLIKILSIIFLIFFIIVFFDGYIAIKSEIKTYQNNLVNNFIQLGNTISYEIIEAWQTAGIKKAIEVINRLNSKDHEISVNLVFRDISSNSSYRLFIPMKSIKIENGKFYRVIANDKSEFLYAYFPLKINESVLGFIELSQSLSHIKILRQKGFYRIIIISILLLLFGIILIWIFGVKFISRPLDILIQRTKRISKGDFRILKELKSKDELFELENAINIMCEGLGNSRKKIEEETVEKIKAIEELRHSERLAVVGKIASGIAHELGTPLNLIEDRASMLLKPGIKKGEISQYVGIIIDQVNKMTISIQEMLNYVRREKGQFKTDDIIKIISASRSLLIPLAKKNKINIKINSKYESFKLYIDAAAMEQVFTNIIMNAVDAMPDGGEINITTEKDKINKYFRIKISDQGEGIIENDLERIFDPFFTTKAKGEGTGLGLSLVKTIIEEHKGFIKVESEIGKGTTFIISIPFEEVE